ncbi:MAG: hypothetical protein Q7I99_00030 [Acholeplasmataceae bacterium]|nr:hypothetical protein [Acholeplasmataceae bacterium]
MNKKGVVQLIVGLLIIVISWFWINLDSKSAWYKIAIGLLLGALIEFVTFIWEERKRIKLLIQCNLIKRNQEIRISMAYLFKIEIEGKYFLIKNHRDQIGYQPVGGVYRYLKNENSDLFNDLGIYPCTYMPNDDISKNDLRRRINHRKNLNKFLLWFESKRNRETDPWREFYEELIIDRIIDSRKFPYIQFNLCHSNYSNIKKSSFFPTDEFLYADIYELKWDSDDQEAEFKRLAYSKSDDYIFATRDEIMNGFTAQGKKILPHSKKLFKN